MWSKCFPVCSILLADATLCEVISISPVWLNFSFFHCQVQVSVRKRISFQSKVSDRIYWSLWENRVNFPGIVKSWASGIHSFLELLISRACAAWRRIIRFWTIFLSPNFDETIRYLKLDLPFTVSDCQVQGLVLMVWLKHLHVYNY